MQASMITDKCYIHHAVKIYMKLDREKQEKACFSLSTQKKIISLTPEQ